MTDGNRTLVDFQYKRLKPALDKLGFIQKKYYLLKGQTSWLTLSQEFNEKEHVMSAPTVDLFFTKCFPVISRKEAVAHVWGSVGSASVNLTNALVKELNRIGVKARATKYKSDLVVAYDAGDWLNICTAKAETATATAQADLDIGCGEASLSIQLNGSTSYLNFYDFLKSVQDMYLCGDNVFLADDYLNDITISNGQIEGDVGNYTFEKGKMQGVQDNRAGGIYLHALASEATVSLGRIDYVCKAWNLLTEKMPTEGRFEFAGRDAIPASSERGKALAKKYFPKFVAELAKIKTLAKQIVSSAEKQSITKAVYANGKIYPWKKDALKIVLSNSVLLATDIPTAYGKALIQLDPYNTTMYADKNGVDFEGKKLLYFENSKLHINFFSKPVVKLGKSSYTKIKDWAKNGKPVTKSQAERLEQVLKFSTEVANASLAEAKRVHAALIESFNRIYG